MKVSLTLFLFFWAGISKAQSDAYLSDLPALYSILQKTPSYKAQIKGSRLHMYNAVYARLAADTVGNVTDYRYFYNLAQLLFPLKDNHLGFYQLPDYASFKNQESIAKYTTTKAFSDYPKCGLNLDSLKSVLAGKPVESVEGIYHYDRFYSVGLFKNRDKEYIGVVIDSDVALWPRGQVALHLYEYGPNLYKAIYGHPLTKNFLLQPVEKYRNGSLINSHFYNSYSQKTYAKQLRQQDFVNLPEYAPKFELKHVAGDIQYLLIRTFQADKATMQQSTAFYEAIKNRLTAPSLILDLRNNDGGAKKASGKYLQLLKKYAKKGHVFILLNNETLSQAEILTLRLKKLKNVTTIGQTTKGMLVYGSNYGKREKLPSRNFEIYITDMKGSAKHLRYEDDGIDPDIFLDDQSGWLEQVIEFIRRK